MPKYKVTYSEHQIREIDIEADTPEEAERIVMDGDADYDTSHEVDADVADVCDVELVEE